MPASSSALPMHNLPLWHAGAAFRRAVPAALHQCRAYTGAPVPLCYLCVTAITIATLPKGRKK